LIGWSAFALASARHARAQDAETVPSWLRMVVLDGREGCPDSAAVVRRMRELQPELAIAEPTMPELTIELSSSSTGRVARLWIAERAGLRAIELADVDCASALEALSVAAAILIDEARSTPQTGNTPPPAEPEPAAVVEVTRAAPPPAPRAAAVPAVEPDQAGMTAAGLWLVLNGGPTWGLVSGIGLLGMAGFEIGGQRWLLGLQGFLTTEHQEDLGQRAVQAQLLGAELAACVLPLELWRATALRACGLFALAELHASGQGAGAFTRTLPWLAPGVTLGLQGLWPALRLGWYASLATLFPLRRDAFTIAGEQGQSTTELLGVRLNVGLRVQLY
jgi:hypothetical protein